MDVDSDSLGIQLDHQVENKCSAQQKVFDGCNLEGSTWIKNWIQKRTFLFTNILQSVALGSKIQGASWKNLLKSAKGSSLPNISLKRSWHQGNPANEAAQHGISQQYHGDIISYDAMFPYNFPCSKGGTLPDFTGYLWCTVIWVKACKGNRIKICLEIDPPTHRTSAHSMLVPEPSSPFQITIVPPKKKETNCHGMFITRFGGVFTLELLL